MTGEKGSALRVRGLLAVGVGGSTGVVGVLMYILEIEQLCVTARVWVAFLLDTWLLSHLRFRTGQKYSALFEIVIF